MSMDELCYQLEQHCALDEYRQAFIDYCCGDGNE